MAKKRILIVEDERLLLDLYVSVLLSQGRDARCEVVKAESAEEANRAAREEDFDLVLTDYHLPGEDGISLIRSIRARSPRTAFVLISGYLSPDIQKQALEAGALTCLKKPCSINAIIDTVERTLAGSAADRPAAVPAHTEADARPDPGLAECKAFAEGALHPALVIDREHTILHANARFSAQYAPLGDHAALRCHELLFGTPLPCPRCPLRGEPDPAPAERERRLRLGETVVERIEPAGGGRFMVSLTPRFSEETDANGPSASARPGALDFFMIALDSRGRIVFSDEHFPRLLGAAKNGVLGRDLADFLYPYFLHYLVKQETDFMKYAASCGDRPVTLDFVSGRPADRHPFLCEFIWRDAAFPGAWELLVIGLDIRQQLELNKLIEFERESFHRLRAGQFDMVITIDQDFKIKSINNACLAKLDARLRDLADTDFTALLARPCDRQAFAQGLAQAGALTDVVNLRLDIARDGKTIPTLSNISAVRDSFNDELGYVIVLRDIERELKMEATLRHVERMQALGQLAAGTAHQINNYTNAILGSAELLAESIRDSLADRPVAAGEAAGTLAVIQESVQKLTALTRHLTAFARAQQAPVISAGDVNRVVTDTLELTRTHLAKKAVALETALAEGLPPVFFSPLHLEQAVLNLLMNAVDAVGSRNGRIRVATGRDGDEVCIAIADNGPGIPAEIRSRLFEAFVTTKPEGVGTGLGLNVARDVVESIKGRIKVESEAGRGTTMTIRLPVPGKGQAHSV